MHSRVRLSSLWLVSLCLGVLSSAIVAAAAQPAVRLVDLDNRPVDPFQASHEAKAVVFLYTSIDCPISNRYAPEVLRLHRAFAAKGVDLWLIYPNPAESAAAIRNHL